MRAPSSSKSARLSGVTTTTSPSKTTSPSAVRANSGSLSVHSVLARDHSQTRVGFTWARQRYLSSLLSCTQPSAAGGAGTAVGSYAGKERSFAHQCRRSWPRSTTRSCPTPDRMRA